MPFVGVKIWLDRLQALLHRRRDIGNLSVRQNLARLDGVAVADLPRRDTDLRCQHIDQRFQRVFALADTESTESAGRRIVGIPAVAADIGILIGIRSDRMRAGTLEHRSAKRCIGTGVEIDLTVETGKMSVLVAAQGKGSLHRMPFRMEIDGFLPCQAYLDRPSADAGCQGSQMLHGYVFLAAETAAHELIFHDNAVRLIVPAEHVKDLLAAVERALVGAEHLDAVFVRQRDRAFRLEESVLRKRCPESAGCRVGGFLQRLGRIAAHNVALLAKVAALMHLRGIFRFGLRDAAHRLHLLVFHLDKFLRLLEDIRRFRHNQAERIGKIMRDAAFPDHDIPVLLDVADLVDRHIVCCQDGNHTRQCAGRLRINFQNPGTRIGGADSRRIHHIRHIGFHDLVFAAAGIIFIRYDRAGLQMHASAAHLPRHALFQRMCLLTALADKEFRTDVVRIFSVAKHLPAHIDTEGALADAEPFSFFHIIYGSIAAQHRRCRHDRLDDFLIACTAADIAADGTADFFLGRVRFPVDQGFAAHDHARYAEAALNGAPRTESIDKCFLFPQGKSLHCGNGFPLRKSRRQHAGLVGPAVRDHRAGAAGAFRAAVFCRIQPEIITQIAQKRLVLFRCLRNAIDCKCICHIGTSSLSLLRQQSAEHPWIIVDNCQNQSADIFICFLTGLLRIKLRHLAVHAYTYAARNHHKAAVFGIFKVFLAPEQREFVAVRTSVIRRHPRRLRRLSDSRGTASQAFH